MTTTPLATIAEALIEFILSLLRDPQLAADFEADPDKVLARAGLADICATDVRQGGPGGRGRAGGGGKPVPAPGRRRVGGRGRRRGPPSR